MTPLEVGIQGVKTSAHPQSEKNGPEKEGKYAKKGKGKSASQRDGAEREEQPWKGALETRKGEQRRRMWVTWNVLCTNWRAISIVRRQREARIVSCAVMVWNLFLSAGN